MEISGLTFVCGTHIHVVHGNHTSSRNPSESEWYESLSTLGTGKLPIMKPHDKTWYQISDFFVNYTYALGCVSIVEAILGGVLAHKLHLDQRTVTSNSDLKDQIPQDIKDALINEDN